MVLWALVVMLAVVVVALARQIGMLHLRLGPRGALEMDDEGLPLGEAPPPQDVRDINGDGITVGGPGHSQLLLFISPGCMVCGQVLPGLKVLARTYGLDPIAISDQDDIETRRGLGDLSNVRVVAGPDLATRYQVPGTPYVFVTDETGAIRGKGTVNNLEQFEGLIATAERRSRDPRPAG